MSTKETRPKKGDLVCWKHDRSWRGDKKGIFLKANFQGVWIYWLQFNKTFYNSHIEDVVLYPRQK